MGDLKSNKLIYLKGFLFFIILVVSSALLLFVDEIWQRAVLIALLIWSSARLYYFMFYVIERYVDPEYRFSGIYDFLKYLFRSRND